MERPAGEPPTPTYIHICTHTPVCLFFLRAATSTAKPPHLAPSTPQSTTGPILGPNAHQTNQAGGAGTNSTPHPSSPEVTEPCKHNVSATPAHRTAQNTTFPQHRPTEPCQTQCFCNIGLQNRVKHSVFVTLAHITVYTNCVFATYIPQTRCPSNPVLRAAGPQGVAQQMSLKPDAANRRPAGRRSTDI